MGATSGIDEVLDILNGHYASTWFRGSFLPSADLNESKPYKQNLPTNQISEATTSEQIKSKSMEVELELYHFRRVLVNLSMTFYFWRKWTKKSENQKNKLIRVGK